MSRVEGKMSRVEGKYRGFRNVVYIQVLSIWTLRFRKNQASAHNFILVREIGPREMQIINVLFICIFYLCI